MFAIKKNLAALKLKYPSLYQFAIFCVVGTSGLAIMLITYYLFLWVGLNKQVANMAGFFMSTAYSYVLDFVFVFDSKGTKHKGAATKFFILYFVLYLYSAFLIYFIVDVLKISELIVPVINAILITPPSFLGSKFWVFRKKKSL